MKTSLFCVIDLLTTNLAYTLEEIKQESILFASKKKVKSAGKLCIKYNDINIKQYSNVCYLGCILNNTFSGDSMALKVIGKNNSRLRFLCMNCSVLKNSVIHG